MKSVLARLKPLLRWFILGAVVVFLLQVLRKNWQEATTIRIDAAGWAALVIALGTTLLAHICAGWVWSRMLRHDFHQAVSATQLIQAYLQTNIAKYLPGNIWHYYGRVAAATQAGATLETATVSVLVEPLLMAASALLVALISGQTIAAHFGWMVLVFLWLILLVTLAAVQPRVLNPLLQRLAKAKQKNSTAIVPSRLDHYPFRALLGNLTFLWLRGIGFLFAFLAISPFDLTQVPLLLSGFSLAWLLGLIVPGAPGGLGVFEATAIALLEPLHPPAKLLAVVACYRLVSSLAEALGAGLAWIDQQAMGKVADSVQVSSDSKSSS
ncbi:MAG: lysylphosphatidylglycerol synthase domain-containing protein [Leptolyngbyaceae cyanobacterium bins.302]|nr:lysylphosphatidylglycerol synthase domain-containing protein [Leptolyngbyaceae cyanobacterium bins.302]